MTQILGKQVLAPAGQGFQDFVKPPALLTAIDGAPAAGQFRSEVVNRASMPDLANDLMLRMGIQRIPTKQIVRLQNEVGPDDEQVFGVVNDKFGQMRFVGDWTNITSTNGTTNFAATGTSAFIEITFFGTALNILTLAFTASNRDYRATVDGGAEGANFYPASVSGILTNRNYSQNLVMNVVSGLSLGLHTVKIRDASGSFSINAYGLEVITTNTTPTELRTQPGSSFIKGNERVLSVVDSQSFNTGFESGSLSTRGGNVLVYQKADGSIAKAAQPTDVAQGNLGSANHVNEEIIRIHNWREFGAGRADDFSSIEGAGPADKAFTLEDGTTTLVGNDVTKKVAANLDSLTINSVGDFITLTFMGTGLDIIYSKRLTGTFDYQVEVDGSNIGVLFDPEGTLGLDVSRQIKVVSGLPYGSHVVKIFGGGTAGGEFNLTEFITYGPKLPDLPADAQKIGSYFVLADFVANVAAGLNTISTGILRKQNIRELVYINGAGGTFDWALNSTVINAISGFTNRTDRSGSLEYTFFGTGFDLRWLGETDKSATVDVTVDGTVLTAANFPTASFSTYGAAGIGFNSGTGVLDQSIAAGTDLGQGFITSGLPLGLHTVKFSNGAAGSRLTIDALDIITPIYSPQDDEQSLQNAFPIGSMSLKDLREFSPVKGVDDIPNWAQVFGVAESPTTTNTFTTPAPDMQTVVKTKGNPIRITWRFATRNANFSAQTNFKIWVDGIRVGKTSGNNQQAAGQNMTASDTLIVPVAAGFHHVMITWEVSSGTATLISSIRQLNVQELK